MPEPLIAHYPILKRSSCRLLPLDGPTGALTHGTFTDLLDKSNSGDLLVPNNTRMVPACLLGRKANGGEVGVLVEWMLGEKRILAYIRASGAPKPGAELLLGDDESTNTTMAAYHSTLFEVEFSNDRSVLDILNSIGHIPLPPYISRPGEDADRELYQTAYNERPGAIIAPTAGLHLGEPLLEELRAKDVKTAFMALHVDAGTLQPVRIDTIEDHITHSECAEIPQDVADAVLTTKTRGGRMITISTTLVRSLKNAAQVAKNDLIEPFFGGTQISIYPGLQYKVVDVLVTNSHFPESTLIILASAFTGYQHAMNAYKAAVEEKYRFLNYGDMIFITCNPQAVNEHVGEQFRGAGLDIGLLF